MGIKLLLRRAHARAFEHQDNLHQPLQGHHALTQAEPWDTLQSCPLHTQGGNSPDGDPGQDVIQERWSLALPSILTLWLASVT